MMFQNIQYKSKSQENLFRKVDAGLRKIGYSGLIEYKYPFKDYFAPNTPERTVPATTLGYSSGSYEATCIAILLSNGKSGTQLVNDYRAVGAPIALEIQDQCVVVWRVGSDKSAHIQQDIVTPSQIESFVHKKATAWAPEAIMRAKSIPNEVAAQQLALFDPSLIPALEFQVKEKLHQTLLDALAIAKSRLGAKSEDQCTLIELFRLVFRFLAAKVLHDRKIDGFKSFSTDTDPHRVLSKTEKYYRQEHEPAIRDKKIQQKVFTKIWESIDFRNLSVNILADIYEHTLVSKEHRQKHGIHSTPIHIARYIVNNLITKKAKGLILEPCSGHGVFLVMALQQIKNIINIEDHKERHQYFVKTLRGYEQDAFAHEVSKLSLILADFPNPNGWKLERGDVFLSEQFVKDLPKAQFVFCNPPFEGELPLNLLDLVLEHLHPAGMLGFVLPPRIVDGKQYRKIRNLLANRFGEIEIVFLPDNTYHVSRIESVILLAKKPHSKKNFSPLKISYSEVRNKDSKKFEIEQKTSYRETAERTVADAVDSFIVPYPLDVWERLENNPKLGQVATVRKGINWGACKEKCEYSDKRKKGHVKGYGQIKNDFGLCCPPKTTWLKLPEKVVTKKAFDFPWDKPKVIVNSHRTSRSPWRLLAFVDDENLYCSQSFHCIWPHTERFSLKVFASILFGPVANAYVSAREFRRDNRAQTIEDIPMPKLSQDEQKEIAALYDQYESLASVLFKQDEMKKVLLKIDALVLRGYNLPPRLERKILDCFSGYQRNVGFEFKEYFPESFTPTIPLAMYISDDYQKHDGEYFLKHIPKITDPSILKALKEVE